MKNEITMVKRITLIILSVFICANVSQAESKIIQKEEMAFDKCLQVIKISEDKLSINSKVSDVLDNKRIAIFTLSDGTLTITCDRIDGNIVVSVEEN